MLGKQKGYEIVSGKGVISKKYKEVLLHNFIDFEENQLGKNINKQQWYCCYSR